jgi:hypothetical protein
MGERRGKFHTEQKLPGTGIPADIRRNSERKTEYRRKWNRESADVNKFTSADCNRNGRFA